MSARLSTPPIDLTGFTPPLTLRFTHNFELKKDFSLQGNGAFLEIEVDDGGFTHLDLPVYNGTITDPGGCDTLGLPNPLIGRTAFLGSSDGWITESINLDAYAGEVIRIGFRLATDCATYAAPEPSSAARWYIDDLVLSGR